MTTETTAAQLADALAAGMEARQGRQIGRELTAEQEAALNLLDRLELAQGSARFAHEQGHPRAAAAQPVMVTLLAGLPVGSAEGGMLLLAWQNAYQAAADAEAERVLA